MLKLHKGQKGSATTTYPNRYYSVENDGSVATTSVYIFLPNGEPIAMVIGTGSATTTSYIHTDHLGSTNILTDEFGEVTQTLDYYPYGGVRIDTGDNLADRQYIGERHDSESNLSYLNARYYNGNVGQFLSQDSVFLHLVNPQQLKQLGISQQQLLIDPQMQNSYGYGRGNPMVNKDPSGNSSIAIESLEIISYIKLFTDFTKSGFAGPMESIEQGENKKASVIMASTVSVATLAAAGPQIVGLAVGTTLLDLLSGYCNKNVCKNFEYVKNDKIKREVDGKQLTKYISRNQPQSSVGVSGSVSQNLHSGSLGDQFKALFTGLSSFSSFLSSYSAGLSSSDEDNASDETD